jgi:hypothetical protein
VRAVPQIPELFSGKEIRAHIRNNALDARHITRTAQPGRVDGEKPPRAMPGMLNAVRSARTFVSRQSEDR